MPFTFDLLQHPIIFHRPRRLNPSSAWLEHIPFAMFLVDLLKPNVLVELGTQKGDSYCAFCEAVEVLGLRTRCYAIDSWTGDPHAGTYGPDILADLRAHHDPLYGGFSRLVQGTFDDALAHFSDESIDLLHIDGYHTYEAVRHDFEAWRPKMSHHGVILFHDINVREKDFGAWRVWEEVKRVHPSFEFAHAQGLGVLGVGATLPEAIRALFGLSDEESAAIQGCFFRLGHRFRLLADLEVAERCLAEERAERERAVEWLTGEVARVTEERAERERAVEWLTGEVARVTEERAERERAVESLTGQLQRVREQELQMQGEAGRSRPELDVLLDAKGGRRTARLRRLWAVLRRLRDGWHRLAYDAMPFREITPVAVEAGAQNAPEEVIRWVGPMQIAQLSTPTLYAHPPARVTYHFTMPPRATFRSLIALTPEVWGRNPSGVDFSVSVSATNGSRSVQRRWRIDPTNIARHRGWMACCVGLARFARQEVELTLSTSAPAGASTAFAHALWGEPALFARKPAREICTASVALLTFHGVRGDVGRNRREVRAAAHPPAGATPGHSRVPATGLPIPPPSAPSTRFCLERTWQDKLRLFLSDPAAALAFPAFPDPLVSIVIPTFNKAAYLYQCLESILAHANVPFELIVVDDCSQDDTPELLERLKNVTWARNETNVEFIRTCNRGIGLAKGRYLLFLNNDVTVTPQWLSILVETMERYPQCGAVQGKLVRPEGTLQEAGSIIWRDGSALGYGRDDDPLRPEYCYLREVDYCSAACLLVRAELVQKLGGFDERYLPAFYEDADLCFGVRRLGHTVVFQPQVSVFHYEFGSRSRQRAEALCKANRPKFAKKWAAELQSHSRQGEALRGRDRRNGKRILVMDDQIPAPHLGSGFPRAYTMLHLLAASGFVITFVPLTSGTQHQPATHRLQQLGIEVFYGDTLRVEDLLRERAGGYDVVLISRPHNGARVLPLARRYFPHARIVYDAEALFCVRDFLKAELDGRSVSNGDKQTILRQELDIMKHADVVMTVSESERDIILREEAHPNVVVWGHAHKVHEPITPFAQRRDLLFVGGFVGGHGPNTDAVVYFATTLLPRIRQRLPDARFVVVGTQPPRSIHDLAAPHILVAGYVEDLTEYYERCRVFVAPMQFGAGISLKVIEAMSYGIPAVVSTVGAAGLDLHDGREALIAESDDQFVEKVVQLYEDESLWATLQRAAQGYIRRHCAPEVMRNKLADALSGPGR